MYEYDSIYDEMQQKKKENNARMLSGNDEKKVDTSKCMLSVLSLYAWNNYNRLTSKLCQTCSLMGHARLYSNSVT